MKRIELKRAYKMSDADLPQLADKIVLFATRDLALLADYGVITDTIEEIEDLSEEMKNKETDQELMADMMIATEEKDAKRELVLSATRQIVERAKIKLGDDSSIVKRFGAQLLSKNTDAQLVRVGNRVIRTATKYLPELTSEGVTTILIADLLAKNQQFDASLEAQEDAISERDIAVQERIALGNDLYAKVVNLAAKGKLCFLETDEARYNDYVLYASSESPDTGNTVEGNVAANSVVNISATGISADTVFEIKNTGDADLKFYFAQNPTDSAGLTFILITSGQNRTTTAIELGFNAALNYDRLNVNNEMAVEGSYEITY